jgi:hypothetical protein
MNTRNTNDNPPATQNKRIKPTMHQCAEAGCLSYCACQPMDPWIYGVVGAGVGLGVGALIAHLWR